MTDIYTLLGQYDDLVAERSDIQRRIDSLTREINKTLSTVVADTVEGTRPDGTYGTIKITGIPMREMDERSGKLQKKREQYEAVKRHIDELIDEIEAAASTVRDPSVRTIIRLRYIDAKPWDQVARAMKMTPDQCRMRLARYFSKK